MTYRGRHSSGSVDVLQLLRLKCEGYTTMNDTDEDPDALKRVNDRNGVAGSPSPNANPLAPASLYLTAIIECVDPFFIPRAI